MSEQLTEDLILLKRETFSSENVVRFIVSLYRNVYGYFVVFHDLSKFGPSLAQQEFPDNIPYSQFREKLEIAEQIYDSCTYAARRESHNVVIRKRA